MKAAATVPEWLSGHHADGSPSKHPHAAFFPLPFVGREHADGHIMGLAIALPRGLESEAQVLAPLFFDIQNGEERAVHLWRSDGFWDWRLEREKRVKPPISLSAETWARRSRAWASVTPVVLHHYPKKSRIDDVERIVREAFLSALLPEPEEVRVQSVSAVTGAGLAAALPPFREGGDGLCTYQTHVSVRFPNYVRGPVLVGRGRFRGYGLFRPMDELQGGSQ
jgi:CRISPR-associated protein Csb2